MGDKKVYKIFNLFSASEIVKLQALPSYVRAIALISRAYRERLDISNNPEARHMVDVSAAFTDDLRKTVGLLHDIVEDKIVTYDDLALLGFSDFIIATIHLLTHDKSIYPNYPDYITSIIESGSIVALEVKIADMENNMSKGRMDLLTPDKREYLLNKYTPELPRLKNALWVYQNQNMKRERVICS